MKNWPASERPRERLWRQGIAALSDAELLCLFLRSGRPGTHVRDLAQALLTDCGGLSGLAQCPPQQLLQVSGLGPAKVATLLAAFELGKRLLHTQVAKRSLIEAAEDLFKLLRHDCVGQKQEVFQAVLLNARHEVSKLLVLGKGDVDKVTLSIPQILRQLLQEACAAVIFVHNHPSGDPSPSPEDQDLTYRLKAACDTVGLTCLDHLIIGESDYFSFSESGLL